MYTVSDKGEPQTENNLVQKEFSQILDAGSDHLNIFGNLPECLKN